MTTNQPRQYQSKKVSELRANADPAIVNKAKKSMLLAAKIEDAISKKGLNKTSFAQLMNVQPSVITRWLSGMHNFTVDTLFDIEHKLNINLFSFEENKKHTVLQVTVVVPAENRVALPITRPWELVDHSAVSREFSHVYYNNGTIDRGKLNQLKTLKNEC